MCDERQVRQEAADVYSSRTTISVVRLVMKEQVGGKVVQHHANATPIELDVLAWAGGSSFAIALGGLT